MTLTRTNFGKRIGFLYGKLMDYDGIKIKFIPIIKKQKDNGIDEDGSVYENAMNDYKKGVNTISLSDYMIKRGLTK